MVRVGRRETNLQQQTIKATLKHVEKNVHPVKRATTRACAIKVSAPMVLTCTNCVSALLAPLSAHNRQQFNLPFEKGYAGCELLVYSIWLKGD